MHKAFSSLRTRVLLLIAIPFAVTLGMVLYHTLGEREDQLTNARRRVLDTARAMAGEQQRIIEHVHQVLLSAALLPEVRREVASEECNRALAARHQQEPNLISILLALANGDVICNAIPTAHRISIADRDLFKAAIQTRKFSVGGYVISRTTGVPALNFIYPLLDEAGVPRAVVATTLSLAWLEQELAKAQLPEGSRVVVVDGEGRVLARHPDPEKWVGRSAAELPLLRSILAKGGEGTEEDVGPTGVRQIFGFVPLHRTASGQVYLWVAIPKDVVVGPAEREFVVNLLVALALLVLTFGALWLGSESLFVRRIAALADAAEKLGKGNLATRVGFKASGDEIGQLAQSFDRMVAEVQLSHATLEQRVRERTKQLEAANKEMEAFAYSVSHDLRVPLRAVDGFSRKLEKTFQDTLGEEGRRLIGVIRDSAQKMGRLIDDILAFSRIGRKELAQEDVDMAALARGVAAELASSWEERDLQLQIGEIPHARGDPAMLRQIWVNLLANAVKFTRPKPSARIEVGAREETGENVYYVKDDGVGFDMQYAPKLFGVFQRLHGVDEFEGTGIGLAIVQRIVARHGGRVWAEGKVNEGATFYFALPKPGSPLIEGSVPAQLAMEVSL